MSERVEIAVIGAGFAGIAAALALRAAGHDDLLILERADAVGGTWRDNTYPGVACDVPSHLYALEGHANPDWSGVFATGSEIRDYLERVVDDTGLRPHVRPHSRLDDARWDEDAARWRLQVSGRPIDADVLVLACGRLTEPRVPEIPGLESFPGPIFHSARWDHDVDLAGARVAVVGTGASAVQLTPEIARRGAAVTLFQRTPAWIVPRGAHAYDADERASFADPAVLDALRAELYHEGERRFASRSGDAAAAASARADALAHLHAQVADPALRAALTPDYAFGCKRVLLSDEFYPALASGAVRLEASALSAVEGSTLIAASGERIEADVLVLATGFEASQQPYAALVRGIDGITLDAHWAQGMTSFASTVVSGFPNLFVLNGPNASLGHNSAVLMMEAQADYVVRSLARRAHHGGVLRPRAEAEAAYTAEIDRAAAGTPWVAGGCHNWYVDERSDRLTLLWPGTVPAFRERLARADGTEFALAAGSAAPGKPEWVVVIPVKAPTVGKSRLQVPGVARTDLARAIAHDTITAAASCPDVARVIVVTEDPALLGPFGPRVQVIAEGGPHGLDAAIARGMQHAGADAPRAALLGDLPALHPADLADALRRARPLRRTVVADAEGTGSTLVTAAQGVRWTSAFGARSFARHVGLGCVPLDVPVGSSLRRDVDTAAQLESATALELGPRTAGLLLPQRGQMR